MSSIPDEIYIDILLRLPVKSTLICKCVCKTWYAMISNPDFVKMHHNLTIRKTNFNLIISKFDRMRLGNVICSVSYDPLSFSSDEFHLYGLEIETPLRCLDFDFVFIGACNYLVCIWSQQKQCFGLWNLDTDEYKELPKSPNQRFRRNIFSYAFGYDYETGDYKVIWLYETIRGILVDIYKTGSDSWKRTQEIPFGMNREGESGVLVNGYFHWLGTKYYDSSLYTIISLDISNERFKELELPEEPPEERKCLTSVGVLKECLCVLVYGVNIELWVMQDYGVEESWTRHCTIFHERILKDCSLRPMWSFSSGEILFANGGSFLVDLVLYDPRDGSARKPNIHVENQISTFLGAMNIIFMKAELHLTSVLMNDD